MTRSAWSRVVLAALALVVVLLNLPESAQPGGAQDDAAAGAGAIIIEIDTPGGRLDAVIQMLATIIDTEVRTVALVDSSAFSAGALVAIASDEIYMTPGAVLGAATPVQGGTGETADEKRLTPTILPCWQGDRERLQLPLEGIDGSRWVARDTCSRSVQAWADGCQVPDYVARLRRSGQSGRRVAATALAAGSPLAG